MGASASEQKGKSEPENAEEDVEERQSNRERLGVRTADRATQSQDGQSASEKKGKSEPENVEEDVARKAKQQRERDWE